MSEMVIRADQLSDTVNKMIEDMNLEVIQKVNQAADNASKKAVKDLKVTSPIRHDGMNRKYPPGSYAKSWHRKMTQDATGVRTWVVYNARHYQLTHLLEHGHIIARTGGRSKAIPHIAPVNDDVSRQYVQEVENMQL